MHSAVLVIDVQRALFDPAPQPFEAREVVQRINAVAAWARASGHTVIFIQHEQPETILAYGGDGWQLHSDLHVDAADHLVRKTTPDSFLHTDLNDLLRRLPVEHLIICGYASEFCVDTTVRRAAGLGYSICLVSDAHTTHDKDHLTGRHIRDHHNCTLPNISSFGVTIAAIQTVDLTHQGKNPP